MDKSEKINPLGYLFGKTWQYSAGNRTQVVAYWIMFILSELINTIMNPLVWAKMIEVITLQGINEGSIRTLSICLALVMVRVLVSWAFHGPARCIERANAFKARVNYYKHLLRGVMTLPLEWHVEHHTGDTIDKVNKGTGALFEFAEESFLPIKSFIQLLASFAVLTYFSLVAGGVVLVLLVISAWITIRFDKVLMGQYRELNRLENQISESVVDAVSNISTIIVLRVEKLVFEAILHKIEKPYELFKRNQRISEFKWFLTGVAAHLMTVFAVLVYFYQNWGAGPGTLVAPFYLLTNYLDRIGELFYQFTSMYSTIVRQKARVMNAEELSADFREENFYNHVLPKDWQMLEVKDLSFSYRGNDGDLNLKHISFTFRRGEKVALVGETGSGKTTLLKIMRDLYHPQSITVSVDGETLPDGFNGIHQAITLVQQDPEILSRTILENITMGAEHELDFVRKFTNMACFTEVVDKLPKKFESSIKEKGVNLSGGQQQRLALSRGLLACYDKDIVLLDEPTSSLDPLTEMVVYQNIFREFAGKTVISTIHQLHLLALFDWIYVFDKGKIVGAGPLAELLSSCPKFVSLWQASQAGTGRRDE